jgi:exonuclease SbcC
MIITRLEATNLLKYQSLTLDIPESGMIAISGPNESGKSTIGEAICFALFGRTFSIDDEHLEKVIRWGDNHCAVTLKFKVGADTYELSRYLERNGSHSAKLMKHPDFDPVARGIEQVDQFLTDLLGFEYEQFVESFYLAQREITTPHPHSEAVKIMAGISPLESVSWEIEHEMAEHYDLLEDIQTESDAMDQELADLALDEGLLEQLEADQVEVSEQSAKVGQLTKELDEGIGHYCQNTQNIDRISQRKSRLGLFQFILFVLAVLFVGTWVSLDPLSHTSESAQWIAFLDKSIPEWRKVSTTNMMYLAISSSAFFLLAMINRSSKTKQINRLREEAARLAFVLRDARHIQVAFDDPLPVFEGQEESEEFEEVSVEELPSRPSDDVFKALIAHVDGGTASTKEVRDYAKAELHWLSYVSELFDAEVAQLEHSIDEEKQRREEAARIQSDFEEVMQRRSQHLADLQIRRRANELVQGAILEASTHFNRDIKDLVGRMLPKFTDGRYEHLQLDENLNVRLFSGQKRDFMDLDEVSSGTQRQVMLALRLSLSQKLLGRKVTGNQFAFLDEPFAFFDEQRTRQALDALRQVSGEMSQVWIVAQDFPADMSSAFDLKIECDHTNTRLSV